MESITYELETGQCLLLELRRGDQVWIERGRLRAQPPARWEGSTLLLREELWPESAHWTADARAAWQCRALQRTTLVWQPRQPLRRRTAAWRELALIAARRISGVLRPSASQPPP